MTSFVASPTPPDLRALLDSFKSEVMQNTNCHKVGIIRAFDPTAQTASVQIATLAQTNQGQIPYPLLTDCPVYFPAGGSAYMTFPVAVGDPCLVLFNDQDIDNWFTTGNVVVPNTERTHSLSDGMVLVGWRTRANPSPSADVTAVTLWNGASFVSVSPNGSVALSSDDGTGFQIGEKTRLSNGSENWALLMQDFLSVLTAWVNTGGSTPNAATVTALNNIKTRFSNLLTSS